MIDTLQSRLNNLIKTINVSSPKLPFNVFFYQGIPHEEVGKIAKAIVPYGKVALLYLKNEHQKLYPQYSCSLQQTENVITHVVLPQTFTDSLSKYSQVFNLAEDVRLIVATDKKLFNLAKYFASVRNIPCVLVVNDLECYDAVNYDIKFLNGKKQDSLVNSCDVHVVVDLDSLRGNKDTISQGYAFTVSHALALTDYRINCLFENQAVIKKAYALTAQASTSIFPLYSFAEQERHEKATEYFFILQIANLLSKGKIFDCFSSAQASKFIDGKINGHTLLKCAISTSKIYKIFLSNNYDKILKYPDYLQRADFVRSKTAISHADATANLLVQLSKIEKIPYPKAFSQILIKDVLSFVNCSNSILSIWTALGGCSNVNEQDFSLAIKHSGDVALNLMSLVRHSGISELI